MNYSFATEYDGPPLHYSLPLAIPLDLTHVPLASPFPSKSDAVSPSSVPIIRPFPSPLPSNPNSVRNNPVFKPNGTIDDAVRDDGVFSPTSVMETAELTADETSGPVGLAECESKRVSMGSEGGLDEDEEELGLGLGLGLGSSDEESEDEFLEGLRIGSSSRSKQRGKSVIPFPTRSPNTLSPLKTLQKPFKKFSCSSCSKGNRFTEKESCLACAKKYCSNCLLDSMGSMPEGRKCINCIGLPILENKRDRIGKSSRLLRRILSEREVNQVMKSERDCDANLARFEDVFVNGEKLSVDELAVLQNCPIPPQKIKQGYYWYDKVSGYWGKIGQKPSKIISANLSIGGELAKDASNGNTGICINGREITKSELKMLKWAGVQCAGRPQFWVNSDGSYLEEGQKKIIGHLWKKPIVKLLCPVLSLPTPASSANPNPIGRVDSVRKSAPYYVEQKPAHKFLLIGSNGSGTSTIFKQAKFLYKTKPFSELEMEELKTIIQRSVYKYVAILLEAREVFEEEFLCENRWNLQIHPSDPGPSTRPPPPPGPSPTSTPYSLPSPSLAGFAEWLLKVRASGSLPAVFPAAAREYAPRAAELWRDPALQATFKRSAAGEAQGLLPLCAGYFLQRIGEICRMDYEPSNTDILHAEGLTLSNGVVSADIIFPHRPSDAAFASDDPDHRETLLKYQLIRMPSKGLNENHKLLNLFDEVRIVIFCISLTDYDQFTTESETPTNKMIKSRDLFAKIVTHPTFRQTDFLLVLNKSDLLDEKLEKTPLSTCEWFCDFAPLISRNRVSNYSSRNNSSLGQIAMHYVGVKFKRFFAALTSGTGKKLYVVPSNGLDSNSVDFALRYAKEIVNWEDDKPDFSNNDSIYTMTEPTEYYSH